MSYARPEVGKIYQPAADVVAVSLGLPRTVTSVETRSYTAHFVVHFTTSDGTGFQSDNLWQRWLAETEAVPIPA